MTPDPLDVLAEIAHHRDLYRAVYRVACDALIENARLERMIQEMREERTRLARHVFGWTAAQATGEES